MLYSVRNMERTVTKYCGKNISEILKNIIHQLHFGGKQETRNNVGEKKVMLLSSSGSTSGSTSNVKTRP